MSRMDPLARWWVAIVLVVSCGAPESKPEVVAASVTPSPAPTPEVGPATPRPPRAVPAPSHPVAALDPLLELLPATRERFVVARDPQTILDGLARIGEGQQASWATFVGDDLPQLRELPDVVAWRRACERAAIRLGDGMVALRVGGIWLAIVGADDPAKVKKQLLPLLAQPRALHCARVPEMSGRVACSSDAATLAAYRPARAGKDVRATLERALGAASVANANVLAMPDREGVALALTTPPGMLQLDVTFGPVADSDPFGRPGRATALAHVQPGQSFAWLRVDAAAALGRLPLPAELASVASGLTGEALVSSPGSEPGLAVLLGVRDPAVGPVLSRAFADAMRSAGPPVGTVESDTIDDIDTVRVGLADTETAAAFEALELVQEARGVVTGPWAAFLVGIPASFIRELSHMRPAPPTSELLDALPGGLGDALHEGTATFALHVELDGLQTPGLREQVAVLAGPQSPWFSDPAQLSAGLALLSSLSSASLWLTHHEGTAIGHVAVRSFGDDHSEDGRAAHAARIAVEAGKRRASEAYGELTVRNRSSPQLLAFIARAGQNGTSGTSSAAAQLVIWGALFRAARSRDRSELPALPDLQWLVP